MEFWKYTPAEIEGMVKQAQKKQTFEHAWFTATLFNSQGGKKDGTAFQPSDFMPEEEKKPVTEDEKKKAVDLECLQWKLLIDNCKKGA